MGSLKNGTLLKSARHDGADLPTAHEQQTAGARGEKSGKRGKSVQAKTSKGNQRSAGRVRPVARGKCNSQKERTTKLSTPGQSGRRRRLEDQVGREYKDSGQADGRHYQEFGSGNEINEPRKDHRNNGQVRVIIRQARLDDGDNGRRNGLGNGDFGADIGRRRTDPTGMGDS